MKRQKEVESTETSMMESVQMTARLALLIGVAMAIGGGIWGATADPINKAFIFDLLVLGLFTGLINITTNRAIPIMAAFGVVLVINIWVHSETAYAPVISFSEKLAADVTDIATAFGVFLAPAAFTTGIIAAIRAVFDTTEPKVDSQEETEPAPEPAPAPAIELPHKTVYIDPIDTSGPFFMH